MQPFCFAEEQYELEKIVVKPAREARQSAFLQKAGAYEKVDAEQLKAHGLASIAQGLDLVSALDLRSRSPFGIQADLSLHGSTYEQVAVLIDGVKVNDPQTGHHNLDLPLTIYDLEKIELIKEGSSSLSGSAAMAGSINIATKKAAPAGIVLDTLFGEHALFGQGFSANIPLADFFSRLSFTHRISSGARPNTDFEEKTGSLFMRQDYGDLSLHSLCGYQEKDFGADSFYSNLFNEEEEHTRTLLINAGADLSSEKFTLKNNLSLRRHRDEFFLRRHQPAQANCHTNYVYGFNSQLNIPFNFADFLIGCEVGQDKIDSTNLGKHDRLHEAGFLGTNFLLFSRLNSEIRFRIDHYQDWSWQESANCAVAYELIPERLSLKGSYGRAFRIPSFTELYYRDAANIGNADLKEERSNSYRMGIETKGEKFTLGLEGFLRQDEDLIDWTRTSLDQPWQATNLGRVDFGGASFNFTYSAQLGVQNCKLNRMALGYSYTTANKKTEGYYSKYALDILTHQLNLDLNSEVFGLTFNWQLKFANRRYGDDYFIANLYLAKKIFYRELSFEPFLQIDNLCDREYSEIAGVIQPGRWIKSGLKFTW
jgi:iron complex outermembrane receptor protein